MNELNSSGNKYELWNSMTKKGYFEHVFTSTDSENAKIATDIQDVFEGSIRKISGSPSSKGLVLHELNNLVEKQFVRDLKIYRDKRESNSFMNYNLQAFNNGNGNKFENKTESNRLLDQDFKVKQNEFDEMMKTKKPDDIDFRTVKDEPFIDNMDDLINETLQKRQLELNEIMNSMPTPDSSSKSQKPISSSTSSNDSRNLPITEPESNPHDSTLDTDNDKLENTIVHHSLPNSFPVSIHEETHKDMFAQPQLDILLRDIRTMKEGDKAILENQIKLIALIDSLTRQMNDISKKIDLLEVTLNQKRKKRNTLPSPTQPNHKSHLQT